MKQLLIFTLLITTLYGCSLNKLQRQENKVARKIEKLKLKYPEAFDSVTTETVRIDTVIKEIRLAGKTEYDTVEVNNYLTKYLPANVNKNQFIRDFLNVARDTILIDSLGIHLRIDGVGVNFSLIKDSQHITAEKSVETIIITETEVVNKIPWWVWLIIGVSILITLLALLRR